MANADNKCKSQVRVAGLNWPICHKCSRAAIKDGFCKQHHPDAVKARAAEADRKYEEKRAKDPLRVARTEIDRQKTIIKNLVDVGKGVLEHFHDDDTRQMRRLRKAIAAASPEDGLTKVLNEPHFIPPGVRDSITGD